jgi:hypothetical protein
MAITSRPRQAIHEAHGQAKEQAKAKEQVRRPKWDIG